jgi:cytochrome b561
MTKSLEFAGGVVVMAAESGRFDQTSIALHWFTVLLIIAQFTSAWLRKAVDHETSFAAVILTMHQRRAC